MRPCRAQNSQRREAAYGPFIQKREISLPHHSRAATSLPWLFRLVLWTSPSFLGLWYCWGLVASEPRPLSYSLLLVLALTYSLLLVPQFSGQDLTHIRPGSRAKFRHAVWHGVVASLHFGMFLLLPIAVVAPIDRVNRGLPINAAWLVQRFLLYGLYLISLAPSGCAAGLLYRFYCRYGDEDMTCNGQGKGTRE
jgi:hypothetical protein